MKTVAKGESKKVLGEDIFNTIKEEILNADVLPGSILDEAKLMLRFGVSRTPIREAIRRLISSDLVGMEPHRSAYVKPLTIDSISEFFEAYQLTQRMVFILSADRISGEAVKAITRVEKQIATACRKQDIRAIRRLNDTFYGMVAEGSSNKFLQELYIKLREFSSRLSAIIHKSLIGDEWDVHAETLQRDHDKIISALADKNCDAIGEISDQDVALFRRKVYKALERRVPEGAQFVSPK
ncbi:MAG: GntR family transcriptional regulator [Woeseia sp.]|nr:GntR family transcriptional regulator [Woeseia sp.]